MKNLNTALLIALATVFSAQANTDVTIDCKLSKTASVSATYFEATGKIEVTERDGSKSEGETYQRMNGADAKKDAIISDLAEYAGVAMDAVEYVDAITLSSSDDGTFTLVSFSSADQVLGKIAVTGMSATVCQ